MLVSPSIGATFTKPSWKCLISIWTSRSPRTSIKFKQN